MRRRWRRDRLVVPRAVPIRDIRSYKGLIKAFKESRRAADMAAASWALVRARSPPPRGVVRGGPAALARPSYGPHSERGTDWSRQPGGRGGGGGNAPSAPPSTPWRGGGGNSPPPTPSASSGGRDKNAPPSTPPAPLGGRDGNTLPLVPPATLGGKRREYPSVSTPVARRATLWPGGAGVTLMPRRDPSGVLRHRALAGSVTVAP